MSELEQCPFCGGEAQIVTIVSAGEPRKYYVACLNACEVQPMTRTYDNAGKAVEVWNIRAGGGVTAVARIERLEKVLADARVALDDALVYVEPSGAINAEIAHTIEAIDAALRQTGGGE